MNKLPLAKRVQILSMLVEGSSMRSISRVVDVSINTVTKILVEAGEACGAYHFDTVTGIKAKRVQCDEIWSFCYAKQKNVADAKAAPEQAGHVWTWTAIDADTKLIISYMVGDRDTDTAMYFMHDLRERCEGRMQLTTDGYKPYLNAVETAFQDDDVDYAQLVKLYGNEPGKTSDKKYSPGVCTGGIKTPVTGKPDNAHISTSYVERSNLTMRMSMRRFTRLTNAFSKKIDNHIHMISLYTVWYNFIRIHKTLKTSPAMAAGISKTLWSIEDIIGLIDARAKQPKRGPYKKRG